MSSGKAFVRPDKNVSIQETNPHGGKLGLKLPVLTGKSGRISAIRIIGSKLTRNEKIAPEDFYCFLEEVYYLKQSVSSRIENYVGVSI